MNIFKQLVIILGICLVGESIVVLLPFSFPSSVVSLVLIAVLLSKKILKEDHIKETADFLLAFMAMFFVPAGIGAFEELDVLKGELPLILAIICISLVVTFLGTCFTAIAVRKLQRRMKKHE